MVVAFTIALAVVAIPTFLLVSGQGDLRDADDRLKTADSNLRTATAEAEGLADEAGRLAAATDLATESNCKRIHNVVLTLEAIIVDGRESLRKYAAEGTITPRQLRRGLADNERARVKLVGADCPPRRRAP